jgi:hypothetical protein
LSLLVDTEARTVTATLNGTKVLEAARLPEAVKLAEITAAGFRFNEPVQGGVPRLGNYRVELRNSAHTGLKLQDTGSAFVMPGRPATFRWKVGSPGPASTIPYVIRDYGGHQVAGGDLPVGEDGSVALERAFARGFAEIEFPGAAQTFGIVAIEPHEGPRDPYFCMDAALAWLEPDAERREGLVKGMARGGIALVRERLGVGTIHPAAGQYNWEGSRQHDTLRKLYAEHQLPLLEILDGGGKHQGKPRDLPGMAVSLGDIGKHWDIWGAVEGDNEPDLRPVPADQYVPLIKVMSYALKNAGLHKPVVSGALATIPPGPFFETCAANGMLEDSDAISYHSYDRPPDVQAMIGRYRKWLAENGHETLPLWNSECGWAWAVGPERPPRAQDVLSALEITAKAVESRVCGVARYFPFVLVYYEEGVKNFGLMGREATPLRSMASYAACISALSGKGYLGDLGGLPFQVKLARVFEGGTAGECLAVLYTGSIKEDATLELGLPVKRAWGADGRVLSVKDGQLPIPDGLAFVWMDRAAVGERLVTETPVRRLYELGQKPLVRERRASPLVLHFLSDKTPSRPSTRRYLVSQETATRFPLHMRVYNLSAAPVEFTPELLLTGKPPQPATPLTIPAMGFQDVDWTFDARADLDIAETRYLKVAGSAKGVAQPLPLAIPLVMEGSLEEHLGRHRKQLPLPVTQLDRWKPNLSSGKSVFSSAGEGTWRMDMKFEKEGSGWTYPVFQLPADLDTTAYNGFLIRGRIAKQAKNIAIIAGSGKKAPRFWVPDLFPADGAWHVVYVPFAEFKPGPGGPGNQNTRLAPQLWETLELGFSSGGENQMEISHLLLVGG